MPMLKEEIEQTPDRDGFDRQARQKEEDEYWAKRRIKRERYAARGVEEVWGLSPTHDELRTIYEEQEEASKLVAEEARKAEKVEKQRLKEAKQKKRKLDSANSDDSSAQSTDSEQEKKGKRRKKSKKEKKSKSKNEKRSKKRKKARVSTSTSSASENEEKADEWVEMTRDMREEQAQKEREEEAEMIGPQIPDYLLAANNQTEDLYFDGKLDAKDRKNMPRSEAAAMAAYAAQGKRIPRRGEIGLSSNEISTFEQVGYVMSGTRHKSMEATRLRKENQILTAEEKRLLSGFSHEQRKEKEDLVMQQFQNLISSKRAQ